MNLAKSHFRRRATARRSEERAAQEVESVDEGDLATVLTVRREVLALPPRQRWALVLRYFADLSVRETADAMRCPEGTVKTLTRTALLALGDRGLIDDQPSSEEAHHG
jgi:RNA polymerase sigma-70 factor (ECF subfamily)